MAIDKVQIGDWCTLIHADSVEIADEIRAMKIDAVIMDPPYGVGVRWGGSRGKMRNTTRAADRRGYFPIEGDSYKTDLSPWFAIARQCLTWGADHLRAQLPDGGRFLSWDKLEGLEAWDDFSDAEFAWHSRAGKTTVISHRYKGMIGSEGPRDHPMQKPLRVMEWCIEQCRLDPGALILDPYIGSGTTGIAAFKRKMRFVGVEIDRRWFDVACERVTRMTADGPLFEIKLSEASPTPGLAP